jgi:hypothetical protein
LTIFAHPRGLGKFLTGLLCFFGVLGELDLGQFEPVVKVQISEKAGPDGVIVIVLYPELVGLLIICLSQ